MHPFIRTLTHRLRRLNRREVRIAVGGLFAVWVAVATAVTIEALVRVRLQGEPFDQPTRFFARPFVLQVGETYDPAWVEAALSRLGYRRAAGSHAAIGEYRLAEDIWQIGRRESWLGDRAVLATARVTPDGEVRAMRDGDGGFLPTFRLEPEPLPRAGTAEVDRTPVTLDAIPDHLVEAVLAIEDQRFYRHHGLDFVRIAGAWVANIRAGEVKQGGSTLSQQLVKNLYLSSSRTLTRKVREMAMAVVLESRYDKREILSAYLNHVYLGQNGATAIHGVGRAAEFYFGKGAAALNLPEAALLAGLIRGPSIYTPFRHPDAALERRNLVLAVMHDRGTIDDAEFEAARAAPIDVEEEPDAVRTARYFVDYVARRARERRGHDARLDGARVITTLDFGLQLAAERAVRDGLAALEREHGNLRVSDGDRLEAALVALDPRTGDILAMVGGRDYGASQFNRAADARRQPGSAFKPVVALAALVYEDEFTLATILEDDTLTVETETGPWRPQNYDAAFRGPVTLRAALEQSLNVPLVRLGLSLGPETIAEMGQRLGVETELRALPSLALGASEVSPLELTRVFATLAAAGFRSDLREILMVLDEDGSVTDEPTVHRERVVDGAVAYLINSALEGAVFRGTGRGLNTFGVPMPVAGKSGTTNNFRDAWFLAYTPRLAVGVWVGFDEGRSVGLTGSRAALPIVGRFLRAALGPAGHGQFPVHEDLEIVEVNPETGERVGFGCGGHPEVFIVGSAPEKGCSRIWPWQWTSGGSDGPDDREWWENLRRRVEQGH